MDLLILKKKIDGFRSTNGQFKNFPSELLLEIRHSWETYPGELGQFRRELGLKVGTLRKLLVESKKLNHMLASAPALEMEHGLVSGSGETEVGPASPGNGLELRIEGELKVIRFPNVETLVEFLRKAS
jgi:hypothetical protein